MYVTCDIKIVDDSRRKNGRKLPSGLVVVFSCLFQFDWSFCLADRKSVV